MGHAVTAAKDATFVPSGRIQYNQTLAIAAPRGLAKSVKFADRPRRPRQSVRKGRGNGPHLLIAVEADQPAWPLGGCWKNVIGGAISEAGKRIARLEGCSDQLEQKRLPPPT